MKAKASTTNTTSSGRARACRQPADRMGLWGWPRPARPPMRCSMMSRDLDAQHRRIVKAVASVEGPTRGASGIGCRLGDQAVDKPGLDAG